MYQHLVFVRAFIRQKKGKIKESLNLKNYYEDFKLAPATSLCILWIYDSLCCCLWSGTNSKYYDMIIKIHVTEKILRESMYCPVGKIKTLSNCAIAIAVREIFPKAKVHHNSIEPFGEEDKDVIWLPIEAVDFISDFDYAKPIERIVMERLAFDVDVPDSIIQRIGIEEVNGVLETSETLEKV